MLKDNPMIKAELARRGLTEEQVTEYLVAIRRPAREFATEHGGEVVMYVPKEGRARPAVFKDGRLVADFPYERDENIEGMCADLGMRLLGNEG